MKPFQIILLAVFGFLALLGVFLFANFGGFGGSSAKVGTVVIWGTLPQSAMNGMVAAIQAGNQDYTGVSYVQKPADTFDSDLADAIAAGNGPDMVVISQEQLLDEQDKLSVIPSSVISERNYLDAYLPIDQLFLAQDGTYGIPFAVDPMVLYYNRSLLTQGGVATPPTTWEAVTGLAENLTQQQAGTVSESVVPFGSYDNVENARGILSLLLLQSGNSITASTNAGVRSQLSTGGSAGAASPAAAAMNFFAQFSNPAKTVYTWNGALPSARQAFLSGNLLFYPGFASELPDLKAANPNLDFDMAAIPQPQTSTGKTDYARTYAFAIPKASKNSSGALTVAQALADSSHAQVVATSLYMAPAARSALSPAANDLYQPVFFPEALVAKGWLSPSPASTDRIFSTMIGNITSGRTDTNTAIQSADQALNAAL